MYLRERERERERERGKPGILSNLITPSILCTSNYNGFGLFCHEAAKEAIGISVGEQKNLMEQRILKRFGHEERDSNLESSDTIKLSNKL